ncbi:MAG: rod-binding protein [Planctomycetota bacterium]
MELQSLAARQAGAFDRSAKPPPTCNIDPERENPELKEAFQDFVGQTFFGQMLGAMRKTVDKPAYLHGGRAEEVFRSQLDQVLAEKMSDASAESFSEPMYQLFTLPRQ